MKITYILKKGLKYYPPCLAQVLYLNDLGVDLTVYHGEDSPYINTLLERRGIRHYLLKADRDSKTRIQSYVGLFRYTKEISVILKKIPKDEVLWFGNCESLLTVSHLVKGRKFVMSVLEWYDVGTNYYRLIRKCIGSAAAVICCEKHRAAMMRCVYHLDKTPIVMPNKPYDDGEDTVSLPETVLSLPREIDGKFTILYQGMIAGDRPLDKIAEAVQKLHDPDMVFLVMGKKSPEMEEKLNGICSQIRFVDFIPAPQHLAVTKLAQVGVANYDQSCLNNVFCAPNKIFEYAKFGIPMICSENPGLSETVGAANAGKCLDFSDADRLADALREIKNHYAEYSACAKEFYDAVDNKSMMKMVLDML